MRKLFLPGFGASGRLYARGLGEGWAALEPPPFRASRGSLGFHRERVLREIARDDRPVWLAGHSMGAALAVLTAAAEPERVARLTLVSPAGLPLRKPIAASLGRFAAQVAQGRYELSEMRQVAGALRSPRAALRLAQAVRRLDVSRELGAVRAAGIPAEVVSCASDTLVTPAHSRAIARLLGADYHELELEGGHMWMLTAWPAFSRLF